LFLDDRIATRLLAANHPPDQSARPAVHDADRLVDCDLYKDNFINFPARWRDLDFTGVLPKGTPVAQCLPVRREFWSGRFETISGEAVGRLQATAAAVTSERGVYRRQFRAPKR